MSLDTPDNPHSRNTAMARLLAEALKSQAKTSVCPDAEVLAAYADRGLAEEELARWESHFADCDRCQKIIASLVTNGEELAGAEVEREGILAAGLSAARELAARNTEKPRLVVWRRPVFWGWLVPAVGMASLVLWFAIERVPPREDLGLQRIVTPSGAPQNEIASGARAGSAAKPDETQVARADLPAPPTALDSSGAVFRDKEKAEANSGITTKKEALAKPEASRKAAEPAPTSEADTLEAREESAKDKSSSSAQADDRKVQIYDSLTAVAPAAPAPAPLPPPPRESDRAVRGGFESASGAPAPNQLKALTQSVTVQIVFASPNRRALWRLGSGGGIERSNDQGQTWQLQSSGVTTDLLAGAAPSENVAWVVGRNGIILRTQDGEHWERVAPPSITQPVAPPSPAPDWIGVEARDALRATIMSRDLRRFVTEDGGRTWAQVR